MSHTTTTNQRPVMGHMAKNWVEFNEETPAVVLNPQAGPLDLMAWVWGELQSVHAAAYTLADARNGIEKGAFNALILHRIDPLLMVFEAAFDQLALDAKKGGAA
ncbi:MAG: hypothetical protein ABIR56_02055 [Polaromonas sp.]